MSDIGVYILTYPGDYHLSKALIRSLRYFHSTLPIMIIPGEGFNRDDHPFDVPVMPNPGGFWQQMRHIDRKFWSFQGPFQKFLYLDADIICLRPIAPFLDKLIQQDGNFIHVQATVDDQKWLQAINDTKHERHEVSQQMVRGQLGNVELLYEFDPDYNPYAFHPFNAGLFASRRLAIDEKSFEDLHKREKEFFNRRLERDFKWNSHDLFFADQGRLNYLVDRLSIRREASMQFYWGGRTKEFSLNQVLEGKAEYNFIHWAGCPRPSPSLYCKWPLLRLLALTFPSLPPDYNAQKELPAFSVWWHFSGDDQEKWRRFSERMKWTWCDTERILRWVSKIVVRFGKRRLQTMRLR